MLQKEKEPSSIKTALSNLSFHFSPFTYHFSFLISIAIQQVANAAKYASFLLTLNSSVS